MLFSVEVSSTSTEPALRALYIVHFDPTHGITMYPRNLQYQQV